MAFPGRASARLPAVPPDQVDAPDAVTPAAPVRPAVSSPSSLPTARPRLASRQVAAIAAKRRLAPRR